MGPHRGAASAEPPRWPPGREIALREIWDGRVWTARPVIVAEDEPDRLITYSPHGNRVRVPVAGDGTPLRLYVPEWATAESSWEGPSVLSFAFPGTAYAVLLLFHPASHAFEGYYVNVQSALVRTEIGFDYVEHLLDARIAPDRSSWAWKDEDELAEAVARGLFTRRDARRFRRWGQRGLRRVLEGRPPFDRDWTGWRPDPGWVSRPRLPRGWETAAPAG